jgi:hypothetical protein
MIKAFVFFIKNRNRSFDLSRLTRSHSRMICLRIWIDSSNCDAMFFSCSSNSWSRYSLTSFCRASLSYCFLTRFVAKSIKIRKKCLISDAHFFLILIIFHFEKAIFEFVIEIVNDVVDELMTNRNTLKTICDSLTRYNRIRIRRTCFVFCFSFDAFCILTIMRCVHDFRTFRTFYIFQWLTNRIRWCDVSWRIFRIRQRFDSVFLCVRIFNSWSIVVKCSFW